MHVKGYAYAIKLLAVILMDTNAVKHATCLSNGMVYSVLAVALG